MKTATWIASIIGAALLWRGNRDVSVVGAVLAFGSPLAYLCLTRGPWRAVKVYALWVLFLWIVIPSSRHRHSFFDFD